MQDKKRPGKYFHKKIKIFWPVLAGWQSLYESGHGNKVRTVMLNGVWHDSLDETELISI
jgi:hypothetical protein